MRTRDTLKHGSILVLAGTMLIVANTALADHGGRDPAASYPTQTSQELS